MDREGLGMGLFIGFPRQTCTNLTYLNLSLQHPQSEYGLQSAAGVLHL